MKSRTILFDLDGTLTDPARGITACIRYALDEMGEVPTSTPLEQFIGPPLDETFRELLTRPSEHDVSLAIEHYRRRFTDTGLYENAVYPGVTETLTELRDAGYDFRVATSKPHVFADRIIDHFELRHFFPQVYGSELSGVRTNKADLIRHVLVEEGLEQGDAWMIGDRKHDILGARANGLPSVGVTWGFGSRVELESAGADHVADTVSELPSIFGPRG